MPAPSSFSHAHVAILSFEGPDRYASIGGLGTRVTELAHALGASGVPTELYFIGDPDLSAVETVAPNVTLRRWGQWISAMHRANVYDGEDGKAKDFESSLPPWLIDHLIAPAAARNERVLVMAEEWHTIGATLALDRMLRERGLRHAATILWNANNTYGFWGVDWGALRAAATITTVSKYMKFEMAQVGVGALVIPNGIPEAILGGPPPALVDGWKRALGTARPALAKIGRFDPDKRWMQAIDAVAELKAMGLQPRLFMRGGREDYGREVMARAHSRGLTVGEVAADSIEQLHTALADVREDVVNLRSFLTNDALYALYAAADAVLANSGKEPFGLVGLEVMAAGGLAVCGSTGEDYVEPFVNAIATDTEDGRELAVYLRDVALDPVRSAALREAGGATAERFTWPTVIDVLERKIAFMEMTQA